MRHLTFSTFLKRTITAYTHNNSLNIHELSEEGKKDARLQELLFLYCCYENKLNSFFKYNKESIVKEFPLLKREEIDDEIYKNNKSSYYYRHYKAYLSKLSDYDRDNEIKLKYLIRIKEMQKQKKISNYKIYTELKANPGNINDFLTNRNCKKVSLSKVRDIYNFVVASN